jgi:hypothetical protein
VDFLTDAGVKNPQTEQAADKLDICVILSEAKNLYSI